MKKIVIFGGGSGLSQLLKGIMQFPWDVTAVVSMSDNGSSTGRLREEFDIPENLVPVALLPVGYKAKLCPPSPLHKIRKNIQELVIYK